MKLISIFWIVIFCFLCITTSTDGARILAIIPIPSYSHQIAYKPLWTALSQRGHEVVVLTSDPSRDPSLMNLTEIDFGFNYLILQKLDFARKRYTHTWLNILYTDLWDISEKLAENIYEHPEVRKIYAPSSDQKFDVIFIETFMTPSIYALAYRINAPIIGVSSLGLYANNYYLFGAPVLTSHPSTWEMEGCAGFNLSLWQRIRNFIQLWYHIYRVMNDFMPRHQAIAERYLGKSIPHMSDMERNISIVLCNQQDAISFVRPKTPNIIPFGSFHVSKRPAMLPKDLKKFVDDAPNGFIYVSLGTNVVMTSFPKYVQDVFHDVFARLPLKVVWKYNGKLSNKSDNIYISKWFPQQSILAHPKIRLFVYQGGLQSTEEAVYYKVPLLGLPVLADQDSQIKKMVSLGVAKYLNIIDITREALNASIIEIVNDKRYKERMLQVKSLSEDKPYDLLKNAIWWTEFVIRHKGAPHLQSDIAHDPWYQKYDMDIIAILSVATFVTLICSLLITYKLLKMLFEINEKMPITYKRKIN